MKRFDLLDEYSSVILPGYGPRHWEADEATARHYSACLKALVLAVFGGALVLGSLHGLIFAEPESAMQAVAGR